MSISQYKRYKCDNCGKEKEMRSDFGDEFPTGWFRIEIYSFSQGIGTARFYKEVCSHKCVKEVMSKFKGLPRRKREKKRLIVHP